MPDFLALAKEAFDASSSYMDANLRNDWEYSLRAFRSEHATGSKYLSDEYKSRSRLFRPKTRSIIRKNEAAAMQAAFSNREIVSVEPGNPDNLMSVAGAACLKEVLEYRLTKTLPTWELYIGGVQDAQTTGVVCSYQYWEFEQRNGKKIKDKPCIELRPIENIRLDAGASWLDPVNTSPYFCDIIPMYVCDVKAMMTNEDPKTGAPKWKNLGDDVIAKARPEQIDTTRKARLGNKQDPHEEDLAIKNYETVWVLRWFIKEGGQDYTFYTLGTEALLTDPVEIETVYFHGHRPYVIGYAVLETHKALKQGLPMLTKPLQQETNDIANQRLDNVKFVLNKRWIVARGRQVDVQSLVRNVPGGVTLATDPNNDVKESNWPDVTSSSFVEHDRISAEFDDLAGNFTPSTKVANNAVNDTLGGSRMAAAGAGLMTEYLIQTINVTWWERVLRQLALLEQYYETDEVILAVCAQKARLFPKFGLSRITDDLLMQEATVSVSMVLGDPNQRLQKFIAANAAAIQVSVNAPPGANTAEMRKEIYANAGYRGDSRFFNEQQDPRIMQMQQDIQRLEGMLKGKQLEMQQTGQIEQMKIQSNEKIKGAEIQVDQARISGDLQIRQAELAVEGQRLELERLKIQVEVHGANKELELKAAEIESDIQSAQMKLETERQKMFANAHKLAAEQEMQNLELEKVRLETATTVNANQNESRITDVANHVMQSMESIKGELATLKGGLDSAHGAIRDQAAMLGGSMKVMMQPKKKAKGISLKKGDDKKTKAVVVSYDDGTEDELGVS